MASAVSEVSSDSARALEVIFGDPQNVVVSKTHKEKQRRVKYWRKPERYNATDSGWIVPGPDYKTDAPRHERLKDKGWRELPDNFGLQITGMGMEAKEPTTIAWEANPLQRQRPTIWLEPFIKAGGLTYIIKPTEDFGTPGTYLIPADQLVAYGLHRLPGIKDLRPDLAEAVDIECETEGCQNQGDGRRKRFAGVNRAAAERALDMHMASHTGGEGARSAGRELTKALEAMESRGNSLNAEAIAVAVAAAMKALGVTPTLDPTVRPEPPKPPAPRYPDGDPTENWKRPEMMAWAADNGLPMPENRMSMTKEAWWEYLQTEGGISPQEVTE